MVEKVAPCRNPWTTNYRAHEKAATAQRIAPLPRFELFRDV